MFRSPRAAANPASGMISSDGIGGKMFSRNIRRTIPPYPLCDTVLTIHWNKLADPLRCQVMDELLIQVSGISQGFCPERRCRIEETMWRQIMTHESQERAPVPRKSASWHKRD